MIETKTLANGIRVIVKQMRDFCPSPWACSWGRARLTKRTRRTGISHFIEHMLFKGTPTRTAFEISDAFDALGAQVNAFTGKDLTCYYSKSTSDHAAGSVRASCRPVP